MKKENILSGLIGVGIGIVLTVLFTSVWVWRGGNLSSMVGARNTMMWGNQMAGVMDAHFIEQMIPHHDDAITMAGIALDKAQHPEIKQLAQDIQRTQSEEIKKMREWYREWFDQDVPDTFANIGHGMGSGVMHMGMMGDVTDIQTLKTAASFDKAFIEEMIPHHQMAVMMAQMLGRTTDRPEMKQLVKDIIEVQSREIDTMRGWYRQWYGQL